MGHRRSQLHVPLHRVSGIHSLLSSPTALFALVLSLSSMLSIPLFLPFFHTPEAPRDLSRERQ